MSGIANITFGEWFQKIYSDIFGVFQMYRSVYCHRAKLAFLCQQLSNFQKSMGQIEIPPDSPSPQQIQRFRDLLKYIADLRNLFACLDASHFIEFVSTANEKYVKSFVSNFCKEFNKVCHEFPFLKQQPFVEDKAQEITDDKADVQDMIQKISGILQDSSVPQQLVILLQRRLGEYQNAFQELNTELVSANITSKALNGEMLRQRLELPDSFYLQKRDFVLKKKIGSGGFADVYEGIQQSTQKVVAIKILHNNEISESLFKSFKREIEIQSKLKNFAILELVGVCLEAPFYIATEFMPKDCLFKRIHSQTKLEPTKKTIIALGCAIALSYMHKLDYIHRDIKSLNILLDADDYPKICDFGMSRKLLHQELMTGGIGTAQWEAPEVISNQLYTEKCDVYSYGILLWEILTGEVPFRGLTQMQVASDVVGNSHRPVIPNVAPPKITKMIKLCWEQDPNRRPSMETVASAIACGEVVFPGTHMSEVQAYLTRFGNDPLVSGIVELSSGKEHQNSGRIYNPRIKNSPTHSKEMSYKDRTQSARVEQTPSEVKLLNMIDLNKPNEALIPMLIEMLKTEDNEPVISLISDLADNPEWCREFHKSDLISRLTIILANTTSPVIAAKIYAAFHKMQIARIDISPTYHAIFASFQKIGDTSMFDVLNLVTCAMKDGVEIPINEAIISKLAAFLQAGNMNHRTMAVDIFQQLIARCENPRLFVSIFGPSIANLIPGGGILSKTITIVTHLIMTGKLEIEFIAAGGFMSFLQLFTTNDPRIPELNENDRKRVFHSFLSLLKVPLNEKILLEFANDLLKTLTCLKDDEVVHFVAATTYTFMKPDLSPVILAKYAEFIKKCLENQDVKVVIIALKVKYYFLLNEKTRYSFLDSGERLTELLNPKNEPVSALAASCLLIFYASLEGENYLKLLNQNLFQYMYYCLSSEFKLTKYALRLFGTISLTYDGAAFLQSNKIPQLAGNFMCSNTLEIQLLGFKAFSTYVITYPMSDTALAAIQISIQSLSNTALAPYPLLMLSSLIVCPIAAINIAPNIGYLIKMLDLADGSHRLLILRLLTKIFGILEARDYFNDINALVELFNKAETFFGTKYWWRLVKLIDVSTGTTTGLKAIAQSNVIEVLKQAIQLRNITTKQKRHINRVFVRIQQIS